MLRYYYKQDGIVAEFIARMIPHAWPRGFGPCQTIGVVDETNELIAGLVYHHMTPTGIIELSAAALPGRPWVTRTTLAIMGRYPFVQCGCQMVMMHVRALDTRLLRQLAAAGFMFIPFPRLYGRQEDGVLCLLTDDDWKTNKFNKRFGHHLASYIKEAA
jgi:hypothetical protein